LIGWGLSPLNFDFVYLANLTASTRSAWPRRVRAAIQEGCWVTAHAVLEFREA
jgi:hypothetical protein